ncbi:MAG TPA: hypothetical protein VIC28_14480 [Thermoanaerobaculia bacterium]|jgi:hypothetical protein
MHRLSVAVAILLLAAARLSGAENQTPAEQVPLTFEVFNLQPASHFTITLGHGRFAGGAQLSKATPPGVLQALKFDGNTLTFEPGPNTLPSGFSKIGFVAPAVFSGPGDGTFDAQAPLLALINAGHGAVAAQAGTFHLALNALPPSCTLGCLEPGMRCDKQPGANCYLYDSTFMCCTVCPTGC